MTARVLMSRKTGDLFEAYRVTFLDQLDVHSNIPGGAVWNFVLAQCNGWIVVLPKKICPFPVYFNPEGVEKMFEDLGEL